MKKFIFTFILLYTFSLLLTARPVFAVENDLGLWAPTYIYLPINDKFRANLEINPRIQKILDT